VLRHWWAFVAASGWLPVVLVITASSIAWSLVTERATGWFAGTVALGIGALGSFVDFKRRGAPLAVSDLESVRRAIDDLPPAARIDLDRPLIGLATDGRGKIVLYVSVGLTGAGRVSIVEADRRGRLLGGQESMRLDLARNRFRERGIAFIPQSGYSDAVWRKVFRRIAD